MAALADHVALVTGGASGIGRAVVERFLAEGAAVAVLDLPGAELPDQGAAEGRVLRLTGDVRSAADQEAAVERTVAAFGALDVLVANAGISDGFAPLHSLSGAQWEATLDQVLGVNVAGVVLGARAALRHLVASRGAIVVTLSNASRLAGGGGVAYTASKHAALGVVRQLAFELAPWVRVNAVAPGGTLTDLRTARALGEGPDGRGAPANPPEGLEELIEEATPLRFAARPADHAAAYVLLASRELSPAMTGTVVDSDAGLGVRGIMAVRGGDDLPALLDLDLSEPPTERRPA